MVMPRGGRIFPRTLQRKENMLTICGRSFDPRLVILDKDGTLIAFHSLWQRWFQLLMEKLAEGAAWRQRILDALPAVLGYDSATGAWDSKGPLTLASTSELVVLLAGLLYTYAGLSWDEAITHVRKAEQQARAALPVSALVRPIGDVAGTLSRWRHAGIRLALATTDERQLTMASLGALGIEGLFEAIVCGDDGIPLKPAPDMVLWLCELLAIPPCQALVIGDTTTYLVMAHEAGAMAAVGVLSGASTEKDLARYTDLIVPDIHHVQVSQPVKD